MSATALMPRDSGIGIFQSRQIVPREEEFADGVPNGASALWASGIDHQKHTESRRKLCAVCARSSNLVRPCRMLSSNLPRAVLDFKSEGQTATALVREDSIFRRRIGQRRTEQRVVVVRAYQLNIVCFAARALGGKVHIVPPHVE
jgi:hypothetical protein